MTTMQMILNDALMVLGGMVIGFLFGCILRPAKHTETEAPAPIDLGYDENNPINGKHTPHHGELIENGGAIWRIM